MAGNMVAKDQNGLGNWEVDIQKELLHNCSCSREQT